jgi:hypothetical protein
MVNGELLNQGLYRPLTIHHSQLTIHHSLLTLTPAYVRKRT